MVLWLPEIAEQAVHPFLDCVAGNSQMVMTDLQQLVPANHLVTQTGDLVAIAAMGCHSRRVGRLFCSRRQHCHITAVFLKYSVVMIDTIEAQEA